MKLIIYSDPRHNADQRHKSTHILNMRDIGLSTSSEFEVASMPHRMALNLAYMTYIRDTSQVSQSQHTLEHDQVSISDKIF